MTILHPTCTYSALLPRYVTRFACIGQGCEDNCCTGWTVIIDKKSFNAYKAIKNAALTERFEKALKRERSQASIANYARIKLNQDTCECPFMEERLCAIHRELGEDKLSDTCYGYPRHSREFCGYFEQALMLSCPEAARLALGAADAFDFVQGTITVRPALVNVAPHHWIPQELMNDIRLFCLQLMRADGLELWQKLAVLGLLCEAISKKIPRGDSVMLESMFKDFATTVESGEIFKNFADLKPDHTSQAVAFVINFLNRIKSAASASQDRIWQKIAGGLGIDMVAGTVVLDELTNNYKNGLARLTEALAPSPFLLENYLLNEMFIRLFPFDGASAYENFLSIVSRLGTLRLMMAAQCNTSGALPETAELIQTVQVFCRLLQHDKNFEMQINAVHKIYDWNNLQNVFRFLPA